jgi:hypothetical protein
VVGIARGEDPSFPGTLVSIDLNDSKASAEAFADLARRHSFDGVVNNLGLVRMHRLGEIDLKDVEDMLRVNLHPTIQTVQAILPTIRAKGWGRIVNLSSVTVVGIAQRTAYAAAKAAVNSFTRTWASSTGPLAESWARAKDIIEAPIDAAHYTFGSLVDQPYSNFRPEPLYESGLRQRARSRGKTGSDFLRERGEVGKTSLGPMRWILPGACSG